MTIIEFDKFIENSNKEYAELKIILSEKYKAKDLIHVNTVEAATNKARLDTEILNVFDKIKQNRFLYSSTKLQFKPILNDVLDNFTCLDKLDKIIQVQLKKQYSDLK
jgi:hypothetical protein